jgi:hypothetical protein
MRQRNLCTQQPLALSSFERNPGSAGTKHSSLQGSCLVLVLVLLSLSRYFLSLNVCKPSQFPHTNWGIFISMLETVPS